MKRILLLIAFLTVAIFVNAQVRWDAASLGLEADAVAFKGIDNGGPESIELENLTVVLEGQTDWLYKAVEGGPITFDYNGNTYDQTQVQGSTNGMEGHMTHSTGSSCAVHFIPTMNGTIDLAFKFGYNKKFYVAALTEDDLDEADFSADMKAYAYDTTKFWGHFIDATTYEFYIPEVGDDGKAVAREDNADSPHFTGATIEVEAGKEYYAWFAGSKIMLCGFVYTAEENTNTSAWDINDATVVKTEYYNLRGVKVAEPGNGLNIVKKTMSNGSISTSKSYFFK
jgi:hypothetical protein